MYKGDRSQPKRNVPFLMKILLNFMGFGPWIGSQAPETGDLDQ